MGTSQHRFGQPDTFPASEAFSSTSSWELAYVELQYLDEQSLIGKQ